MRSARCPGIAMPTTSATTPPARGRAPAIPLPMATSLSRKLSSKLSRVALPSAIFHLSKSQNSRRSGDNVQPDRLAQALRPLTRRWRASANRSKPMSRVVRASASCKPSIDGAFSICSPCVSIKAKRILPCNVHGRAPNPLDPPNAFPVPTFGLSSHVELLVRPHCDEVNNPASRVSIYVISFQVNCLN